MTRLPRLAVFVLALVLAQAPRASAGPYDDLLKHASANTNAVVLIDVKQATASPLAKKEKWAEKMQQSGHGGLGFFPPDAELIAITGEINLTSMVRDFQLGLVKVKSLPNFKELAVREGGAMEEIAGQLTVVSPRNVYLTNTGGALVAAYPADRQYIARWLKADKAGKLPPLAPHLRAAADAAGGNTITIALDLEDAVDASALQFGLGFSPVMVKHPTVNKSALSTFLASTKGLTFAVKVTDTVNATLTVTFSDESARYKTVLKDLFLELVDSYGVSVAGMDQWEAKFVDKTMTLSGPMSTADLRRIVSLFAFPLLEDEKAPAPMEGPNAAATKRYVAAVTTILDDIKRSRESTNYEKTATWHDKAATQLEQLTRNSVDPLAVDAAHQAARGLRAIAASLRGVPIETDAISKKAYVYTSTQSSFGVGVGGWWGGFRPTFIATTQTHTNIPQIQAELAKAVADDKKRRADTWTQIDQIVSSARGKLGEKYKTTF
jgi:hypothetical protein